MTHSQNATNQGQDSSRIARPQSYRLCGLVIASQIELPQVELATRSKREVDAEIILSPIRITPEEMRLAAPGWRVGVNQLHLNVPHLGHFLIRNGCEILVEPLPDSDIDEIRTLLLGPVFSALCHQRGLLPLQANAIRYRDQCFAFLSDKGTSQIALSRKYNDNILPDDICVVDVQAPGGPIAYPGYRQAKLWRDGPGGDNPTTRGEQRKGDLLRKANDPECSETATRPPVALPLTRLYVLSHSREESTDTYIDRLPRPDALAQIVRSTYQSFLVKILDENESHLNACMELIYRVPIFRFRGSTGLSLLEAGNQVIDQHMGQTHQSMF